MSEFVLPEEIEGLFGLIEEGADPSESVTIKFNNGKTFVIPVDGPTTLGDVLDNTDIIISGGTTYFVEGAPAGRDTEVAPGSQITALGNAKAG